jgi:ankyrin repeat protein
MHDQVAVIDWLLVNKADLAAEDGEGRTALHLAALRFRHEAVKRLLDAGAAVNARDARGMTPLHVLAAAGPADGDEVDELLATVAEVLLSRGADLAAADASGFSALQYAADHHRDRLAALLRKHRAGG